MELIDVLLTFLELVFKCILLFSLTLNIGVRFFPYRAIHQIGFSLCAVFLIAYAQFWIYFLSPNAGKAFSYIIFVLGALSTWQLIRTDSLFTKKYFTILLTSILVTLYSYSAATLYPTGRGELVDVGDRYFHHFSDHAIPQMLADKVRNSQPLSPIIGDWLSSDRPPLQTSFLLFFNIEGHSTSTYLMAAIFCQAIALSCMYLFLRRLNVSKKSSLIVFFGLLFSLTISMQLSYVWPKLLGGGFTILGVTFLRSKYKFSSAIISGTAFGLALLAHGATAFGIMGALLASLIVHRPIRLTSYCISCLIASGLLFSWSLYAKYYDPPGNRLAKWHLAGSIGIDEKSLTQVLKENYLEVPVSGVIKNKIDNFIYAAGLKDIFSLDRYEGKLGQFAKLIGEPPTRSIKRMIWQESVKFIFPSMGLLFVGFVLLFFKSNRDNTSCYLLLISVFSYIVWCLLQYGARDLRTGEELFSGAEAWHAPYSLILILLGLLLYVIASTRTWWANGIIVCHILFGIILMILPPVPINFPEPDSIQSIRLFLFVFSLMGFYLVWQKKSRILI